MGWSIAGLELQTRQYILGGLQASGTCESIVPMENLGQNNWGCEGQYVFRLGYSYESQVTTVCQGIAISLDNGGRRDTIIIDF
jgi:hypothetical protein